MAIAYWADRQGHLFVCHGSSRSQAVCRKQRRADRHRTSAHIPLANISVPRRLFSVGTLAVEYFADLVGNLQAPLASKEGGVSGKVSGNARHSHGCNTHFLRLRDLEARGRVPALCPPTLIPDPCREVFRLPRCPHHSVTQELSPPCPPVAKPEIPSLFATANLYYNCYRQTSI